MNRRDKRISVVAAAVVALFTMAPIQASTVTKVASGTAHNALFATSFDGNNGIAVGAGGEIQTTADGGKTWKPEPGPSQGSLTAVAMKGSRRVIAGLMGEVYFSDGGGKWQKSETGTTERALGANVDSSGNAMVVGSFGMMLRSTDGGKSWTNVAPNWVPIFAGSDELTDDFAPSIYAVAIDDKGFGIAVGELSVVLRTEDAGASWQLALGGPVRGSDRPPAIFAATMRADGVGYAVGQSGLVVQTPDHGKTWCSIASGTTANLLGVASLAGGSTLIGGQHTVLHSPDDGKAWNKITGVDIDYGWYSGASQVGDGFIAAGQSGNILRITQ